MANNEYVNKVQFGNTTVMDISDTTAEEGTVVEGYTFYTRSGAPATGTLTDATTSTHGLMSSTDKAKLDGIASGAAVTDVQINSNSILNNGIANIPISSSSDLGVVKINSNYGITINESNELSIMQPAEAQIKLGLGSYTFITAAKQSMSVFYGLAKAAGDTTQALSVNNVGTYTTTAQAAIQAMLGVPSTAVATTSVAGLMSAVDKVAIEDFKSLRLSVDDQGYIIQTITEEAANNA